jgi:hypothetical protein
MYADRVLLHLRACLQVGEPWEDTFAIRSKDGEFRWFLSRAVPIRNGSGESCGGSARTRT